MPVRDGKALVQVLAAIDECGFKPLVWVALNAPRALVEQHAAHTLAGRLRVTPEGLLLLAKDASLWRYGDPKA